MSWLCTETPKIPNGQTQTFVGNQFRMVDPKTKQIYCEMVLGQNSLELKKYQNWRRIKIQTLNTKGISKALKQSKQHFIDPAFPHNNSVLTSEYFQGQVQWLRVRDLIENAVYSKQQTLKTLQKLKLNRKQFQQALILISRSSPTLFKQLVSRNLNPQGLYQYKIFKDGKIRNIAVDDYLPSQKNMPFFVGPVRGNQVYPMLIEKALAKACGTYDRIPQSTEEILQMIFCGPVKKYHIPDLREEQRLNKILKLCMQRHFLTVILSKRQPKLRNYGLNEGQTYNIVFPFFTKINHHNITLKGQKQSQTIYELVSQSKVSGWNGKYSLNDPIWQKVQSSQKFQIYRHLKTNQSFLISEADIGRHFEQLLVFESMDINNKDWCDHQSTNNFPSFTSFNVEEKDRVFIRVTTGSKIRQLLILVRQTQPKQYEFIDSFFTDGTYTSQISAQLQPGKYIIAVYHNWFLENSGKYNIFLASEGQITLNKGGIADIKFLSRMLKSFDEKQYKQQQKSQKNYKMRLEIQKLGLAWLQLYPKTGKSKSLKLQINHDWLHKEGWQVLQPYSNVPSVDFNGDSKEEPFLILKKLDVDSSKKYYFPTAAFIIK